MRIVSLLPSATEIIALLGLTEHLVGVTHECDFPREVTALPHVTGSHIPPELTSAEIDALVRQQMENEPSLYTLDRDRVLQLQPDLIITQTLCGVCAVSGAEVEAVTCSLPSSTRVINLEPMRLTDVLDDIERVGKMTGSERRATEERARLQSRIDAVTTRARNLEHAPRVLLLEWLDPPFSGGHWNPELVRLAGGTELLGEEGQPSRTLTWEQVIDADPEVLIIACCGFDLSRVRKELPRLIAKPFWNDLQCVRNNRVFAVDGSAHFNRPGPRLVDSLELLGHLILPDVHPHPFHIPFEVVAPR